MAAAGMRDWVRAVAEKAARKKTANGRVGRRVNREKELFTLRARHVKQLFADVEGLASAINKELAEQAIKLHRALNPKNLGGIEVPDGARLALEFLERRLEVVVQPIASIGGRPAPLRPLATASVIQYDRSDPSAADWFDLALREDGAWLRKSADGGHGASLTEADVQRLIEWLVS
ncbi:MAG: hypothetical protein B6D46_05380 [Polyangiaceae bacterium UTPRO1]|jgi:hypothetical protein|nr:hypothetical protein [Myxococcales bacterium]OQY67452.1 MAG: hypothetical protein B6D46_05380 [Polyangiaceae bacterium UTPRO1]